MSKEAEKVVNQLKHFAFQLRILTEEVSGIINSTEVREQVDALQETDQITDPFVVGHHMKTNITKSEFQAFMTTLESFDLLMQEVNSTNMDNFLKGFPQLPPG